MVRVVDVDVGGFWGWVRGFGGRGLRLCLELCIL